MIVAGAQPPRLLLDTCAIIYLFNGDAIEADALSAMENAIRLVSPISAWEIGLLATRRTLPRLSFSPDVRTWYRAVLGAPDVHVAPFDVEIALAAAYLPEPLHKDPADRLLIATARTLAVPIVTRDRLILDYALAGHINALAC